MSDETILSIMLTNNRINSNKLRKTWLNNNPEIQKYLENRFKDYDSISEIIYRIKNKIEIRPVCKTCGKRLRFNGAFRDYCSSKCAHANLEVKEKTRNTCIEKYGVDNPLKSNKIRNKIFETSIKKYGSKCPLANNNISLKRTKTWYEKYGVSNPAKNVNVRNKIIQTNNLRYGGNSPFCSRLVQCKSKQSLFENYGVDNPLKSNVIKNKIEQTCLLKYGVDNPFKSDVVRNKIYDSLEKRYGSRRPMLCESIKNKFDFKEIIKNGNNTKRINHTFNTSNVELASYDFLCNIFGENDIIREYKNKDKYPFHVDFYIKSLDLYVELNNHWTHGPHAFDENNINDILLLEEWKNKAVTSKFYSTAINTWTVRDVRKRSIANKNKLQYLEFWTGDDLIHYFKNLC